MAETDDKKTGKPTGPAAPDGTRHDGEASPGQHPEKADDRHAQGFLDYNEGKPTGEFHTPSPEEQASRRKRSIYIGLAIVAFVVLIYAITLLKLSA